MVLYLCGRQCFSLFNAVLFFFFCPTSLGKLCQGGHPLSAGCMCVGAKRFFFESRRRCQRRLEHVTSAVASFGADALVGRSCRQNISEQKRTARRPRISSRGCHVLSQTSPAAPEPERHFQYQQPLLVNVH